MRIEYKSYTAIELDELERERLADILDKLSGGLSNPPMDKLTDSETEFLDEIRNDIR